MTLSESGSYLSTGETATLGYRAMVVCWDTTNWAQVGSHQTHHAKVQSLAISPDDTKVTQSVPNSTALTLVCPSLYPWAGLMTKVWWFGTLHSAGRSAL